MPYPTGEPTWQTSDLASLSSSGLLSGVNPDILGAIAQEESGFENNGAGVNSSGYGGYFGLSTSQVPTSTLETNSQTSFEQQAEIAAADFNSYLDETGGNVASAESIYQTGKTGETGGGVPLVVAANGGPTTSYGSPALLTSDITGGPSNQDSILGSIGGAVGSAAGGTVASGVEDLFGINGGSGLATRILLAIVGLILLAVGVSKLLDRGASPTDVIVEGGQNAAQQGQSLRQRGNSGAAPKGQRPFERHPTGGGGTKHSASKPFDHAAKDAGKGAAAAAMA